MKSWVRYGARAGVLATGLLVVGMTGGQIAQAATATPTVISHPALFDGGDGGDGGDADSGDVDVEIDGINIGGDIDATSGDADGGDGGDGGDLDFDF